MLNLTKFAVRKPVTIIMCLLTIAYFGIQSLLGTKVELTPEMEFPMLVVSTVYAGASPDDIKDLIATKQEDAVSSLDDVKNVYSFSQDNVAIVLVEYNYGTNIDTAYINLKKAIDGIKSDLPDDANEPNIMEMDMNSQPVITLAVGGQVDGNLYTYVENNIKPELEKLGSVGEVSLAGGQKEYISIKLDPEKVAQYGLSMSRIAQFVGAADFTIPAGDVNVGKQNLSVLFFPYSVYLHNAIIYKDFTHSLISCFVPRFNRLPSVITASGADGCNSFTVLPNPLPADVAKSTSFLPLKS